MNKIYYKVDKFYLEIIYQDEKIVEIKRVGYYERQNYYDIFSNGIINKLDDYFDGKNVFFDYQLDLQLSLFQIEVMKIIQQIPYARTSSYEQVAESMGRKSAVRAVANAIGKNPILIMIPCHRVIRKNGKIGGFSAGLDFKEFLLEIERGKNGRSRT